MQILTAVIIITLIFSVTRTNCTARLIYNNNDILLDQNEISNDKCSKQVSELKLSTSISMLDSSSKIIPSGILNGNFFDLGSFDECLSIQQQEGSNKIFGKYCLVTLPIENLLKLIPHKTELLLPKINKTDEKLKEINKLQVVGKKSSLTGYHFGICIPNECIPKDFLKSSIIYSNDDFCYTKEKNGMNIGSIITLVVISFVSIVAFISTIYDLVSLHKSKGEISNKSVLTAFSFYSNSKKLLKTSKNSDQLLCIHGIKTLSMMWVILGHTYANYGLLAAIDNWFSINDWLENPANMLVISATLSVDTFFTIGGLLAAYTFMKTPVSDIKSSFKKVPFAYLHRYLRLTPALAIIVLMYATGLVEHMGDGPRWGSIKELIIENCERKWWSTMLYIQNYHDIQSGSCVSQSWYLSVDMQLFLLTPFILIPLKKWPKIVLPSMVLLTMVGIIIPFFIGYTNKLSGLAFGSTSTSFTKKYYYQTYARFAPYVIGMITGYYIYRLKHNKEVILKNYQAFILWTITLLTLCVCIFDGFKLVKNTENAWLDGIYLGFNRSFWSCAVALLIILCVSNHGGVIDWFLSLPVFQIISKLSYSMYLVHYIVINLVNLSSRNTVHFSNFDVVFQFFGNFVLTLFVSVVFCLLFESPLIVLEKIICNKR